jgi:8-oxo-dGTP pyrophosphatase MutT (NUDIX family)
MHTHLHTSSAGGIVVNDNKVLLIESASRNTIEFPKGTIEPNDTIEGTAIREVKEETGYNVEIVRELDSETYNFTTKAGKRYRKTVYFFLMRLQDDEPPVADLQEGEDFVTHWVPFDEALQRLTYGNSKKLLRHALSVMRKLR